jgi:hypothetical protein
MSHPASSAWRVDTDPFGRVIWAELVYLFSVDAATVSAVADRGVLAAIPFPDSLAQFHPRLIAGMRAGAGPEGYYAVAMQDGSIIFFAVDAEGKIRPGAWNFGIRDLEPLVYGQAPRLHPVTPEPDVTRLDRLYLEALP